ncbi:MAG: helix-turn-helix domain-containing protein [Chloroflexi bacterium]|nr:helix-turn-helix domain-containing protein [Chloroflexota bacterium]
MRYPIQDRILVADPCPLGRVRAQGKVGRLLVAWRLARGWSRKELVKRGHAMGILRPEFTVNSLRRLETRLANRERPSKTLLEEDLRAVARVLEMLPDEQETLLNLLNAKEFSQPNENEVAAILNAATRWASQIWLPAFVVDEFGDLVVVNALLLRLYQQLWNQVQEQRYPPNLIVYLFMPALGFQRLVPNEEEWNRILDENLRFFRFVSFPYHDECYWHYIMHLLMKPPDGSPGDAFYASWHRVEKGHPPTRLAFTVRMGRRYTLHLPEGPRIVVHSMVMPHATPYGTLYFSAYSPGDAATAAFFADLARQVRAQGNEARTFAPWPLTAKKRPPIRRLIRFP